MSKKKAKKNSTQGSYAICITIGLIVGFGLGPIMGGILPSTTFGLLAGIAVAYFLTRRSKGRKIKH
jgi:hypothetical protein